MDESICKGCILRGECLVRNKPCNAFDKIKWLAWELERINKIRDENTDYKEAHKAAEHYFQSLKKSKAANEGLKRQYRTTIDIMRADARRHMEEIDRLKTELKIYAEKFDSMAHGYRKLETLCLDVFEKMPKLLGEKPEQSK